MSALAHLLSRRPGPRYYRGIVKGNRALATAIAIATSAFVRDASAATWSQGTTPRLGQIFSIDKTGETSWIYGAEDVWGDGLPTFLVPEQQRDLRTAYAAADQSRFWARVYVSNASAIDTSVTVYVFIDADKNTATGGGTVSSVLSPQFTTESSPRGYEYVLGLAGNGTIAAVWTWQQSTQSYVTVATQPNDTAAETGQDIDPIRIGAGDHGYVQGNVLLSIVGLTPTCDANLYVRSAASSGPSDLDMSVSTTCVPAQTNGIPTILIPPAGCTSDAQCPQGGVCSNGQCVLAPTCVTAADCPANQTCTADGRCVPTGGGSCTTNANCPNGLVCVGNACVACTQGQNQCGAGMTCAPNGACVPSTGGGGGDGGLPAGSHVEGGAFNCAASGAPNPKVLMFFLGALFLWGSRRRTRRG